MISDRSLKQNGSKLIANTTDFFKYILKLKKKKSSEQLKGGQMMTEFSV